ncbi:MAG: alpha/beta fold hydrolase [Clostridia bacterium]|nr:alpha/beta fold hydrolase [Clostridia bacterium]
MDHSTQIRIIPGSRNAVLLVHGILGTPHQFDAILPAIPPDWTMINLLLDGHGGQVEDFGRSSMRKWETQVRSVVNDLCAAYENVVIIAHSMGTLFAIDAGLAHPDRIKALLLLSPPLKIALKPRLIRQAMQVGLGFGRLDDPDIAAARRAYSMPADRRIWKYLRWIPRYLELFKKIRSTRKRLPMLRTPTKVFLCRRDEMVSVRTDRLFAGLTSAETLYLPSSSHFTYSEEDAQRIRQALTGILKSIP